MRLVTQLFVVLSLLSQAVEGFVSTSRTNVREVNAFVSIKQPARRLMSERTKLFYHDDDDDEGGRQRIKLANTFLKASHSSFKNIEGVTDSLLSNNPMIAILIFVGLGLLVAYISGFAILHGYIDSSFPMDNAAVPYWEEELPPMP